MFLAGELAEALALLTRGGGRGVQARIAGRVRLELLDRGRAVAGRQRLRLQFAEAFGQIQLDSGRGRLPVRRLAVPVNVDDEADQRYQRGSGEQRQVGG